MLRLSMIENTLQHIKACHDTSKVSTLVHRWQGKANMRNRNKRLALSSWINCFSRASSSIRWLCWILKVASGRVKTNYVNLVRITLAPWTVSNAITQASNNVKTRVRRNTFHARDRGSVNSLTLTNTLWAGSALRMEMYIISNIRKLSNASLRQWKAQISNIHHSSKVLPTRWEALSTSMKRQTKPMECRIFSTTKCLTCNTLSNWLRIDFWKHLTVIQRNLRPARRGTNIMGRRHGATAITTCLNERKTPISQRSDIFASALQ